MSKDHRSKGAVRSGATPAEPVRLVLTDDESWQPGDPLPSVQEVVESLGLEYQGMEERAIDAPAPLRVPPALFGRIQHWDREMAGPAQRRQELMDLAIDLLGIDRTVYAPTINLDTGVVTLARRDADVEAPA